MLYDKKNTEAIGLRKDKFFLDVNVYVNVQEMTASDIMYYQAKYKDDANAFDFCCDMVSRSVVDDDGSPIFDDLNDVKTNLRVGTSKLYAIQAKVFDLSKSPAKGEAEKN